MQKQTQKPLKLKQALKQPTKSKKPSKKQAKTVSTPTRSQTSFSTPSLLTIRNNFSTKQSKQSKQSKQLTSPFNLSTIASPHGFAPRSSQQRKFSTQPPSQQHPLIQTTISDQGLYSREATKVLESIIHRLELPDIDYEYEPDLDYSGDVLDFKTHKGTWVLNKHNVTKQIWLSSPISGPSKYNYHPPNFNYDVDHSRIYGEDGIGGVWLSERDNTTKLSTLLKNEWSTIFDGKEMNFQHDF